jgi:CheY-specific phosphatase CheX
MGAFDVIAEAYLAAVREVVEHYAGVEAEACSGAAAPRSGPAAVVGFSDDRVKGSSVLTAEVAAVTALAPVGGVDPRDWIGELNNQVVGRLKNKLIPCGVHVQLGTPITMDGESIRFGAPHAATAGWTVSWPGGALRALLAVSAPPDLVLTPDATAVVAAEGTLCLF